MSGLRWALATERAAGMGGAFTDVLNRAMRDLLSQSGYNPDASTFPGLSGPVYNVLAFGAVGNGVTNDAAAIILAEAAAYAAGGVLYFPHGFNFFTGTTTLTIRCAVKGEGATVTYGGTGTAVVIGQATPTLWLSLSLPKVIQSLKTVNGWAQAGGSDIGVQLLNLDSCQITIPRVNNFAVGLDVHGSANGVAYNTVHIGHLDNNKINLRCSADSTGWSNENTFIGGRCSHLTGEGTAVAGSRHILVDNATLVNNNNRFIGISVEGDVPEFHVECYGQYNYFDRCRWEITATTRKVQFNGASAVLNEINGGYQASGIIITEINSATKNKLVTGDITRHEGGGGAAGLWQLSNTSGSDASTPLIVGLRAGLRPTAAVDSDRTLKVSATQIEMKTAGDANTRLRLDGAGKIWFGNGTLASPTESIRAFGVDGIQHTGTKLGFFGATPVVKPTLPAAATDLATALTLVNAIRTALINNGLTA